MKTLLFENPANGYRQKVEAPIFGSFILGPLYFAFIGAWIPGLIYLVVVTITGGLAWLIMPFWTPSMVRKYYLSQGCKEVEYVKPPVDETKSGEDFMFKAVLGGIAFCSAILGGFMFVITHL